MMFKAKSFDLVAEDKEKKKSERFYQPKRVRWLKYIAIPGLSGFILMLILCNVRFYAETDNIQTKMAAGNRRMNKSSLDADSSLQSGLHPQGRATTCWTVSNMCNVTCDDDLSRLSSTLESFNCKGQLALRLQNCQFPRESIKLNFFSGSYQLKSLVIENCQLSYIEPFAFDHKSTQDISLLHLINTQFTYLKSNVFKGLTNLQYFKWSNKPITWTKFDGANFLQPFAAKLIAAELLQQTWAQSADVYDPSVWFDKNTFAALVSLNLSGNAFGEQLNALTFRQMPALQRLQLANCGLASIEVATIAANWKTLTHMDLSGNRLTHLDDEFVTAACTHQLQLVLHGNAWICTCTNAHLIDYISGNEYEEMPKCDSPAELRQEPMNRLQLQCNMPTISTTTTTTTSTTTLTSTSIESTTIVDSAEVEITTAAASESQTDTTVAAIDSSTKAKPTKPTTTATTTISTTTSMSNKPNWQHTLTCLNLHGNSTYSLPLPYDVQLQIVDRTRTSAAIHLNGLHTNNWQLYHIHQHQQVKLLLASSGPHDMSYTSVHADGLTCAQNYVFCLVSELHTMTTSPLNCRAHRLPACRKLSWFQLHLALVLSLGLVGTLCCLVAGAAAAYVLLRRRPTLLRGTQRLVRTTRDSQKVLLLPKGQEQAAAQQGVRCVEENSYEHIYYKKQLAQQKLLNTVPLAPLELAPAVPANIYTDRRLEAENIYQDLH